MQWSGAICHDQSNKKLWARSHTNFFAEKILPSVSQLLTAIVNSSITLGTFPKPFKGALVWPLIKKANLDLVNKNYSQVSNLAFVGKLIECVVADQITSHITQHSLMEANQSAYHSYHSTETTLLEVKADILRAMDNQEVVCLVLLDLSAPFDTVNHDTLITRLRDRFGIGGTALEWFRSYLSGRSQCVAIGDLIVDGALSDTKSLSHGVPQGSVLGPIAFTLYTTPLGDICRAHDIFSSYMLMTNKSISPLSQLIRVHNHNAWPSYRSVQKIYKHGWALTF